MSVDGDERNSCVSAERNVYIRQYGNSAQIMA